MKEFDIENFPISRTALDMLHSMPEDFYKDSYVMKWLLQVTGTEWDSIKDIIEGLPLQFFPETATWGLIYHEQKWQLPVKYNLGYEERRKLIYQRRDFKAPMTPYKMELYIEKILGIETHITDCHDPGERRFMPGHPNIFKATFVTENTLDVAAVSAVLNKLKQSHTVYTLEDLIQIIINNCEKFLFISIDFRFIVPFWDCKLVNGTKMLDGTRHLNASRRYNLVLGIKNNIKAYVKENIYTGRLYINILPCFNVHENINGLKAVFRLGICWFFIFNNGKQDMPLSITVPVYAHIAQEINIARLVINGMKICTEEKAGAASVLRAGINSLPVKSSLPLKAGFVSCINTPQNMDTSSLVNNGMEVHTEEKAGAASVLKAGINHYKTPGSTRAVPARMWHKAAVVIHESIQGFTVVTEPVQVVFDSSGLANAGFEVVYNGNAVLNPGNLTVYKGDLITIKIQPDEHYSLADGAYVFLSTGNTYVLDNCMATIKIKQECTARITAQVQNDKPTVNFMHDLNGCGFELEHNGKKYINPQSLVVTHGDEINIRLLTTHNGLFATMPGLTVNGKQEEFDCADINNINRYITVNDDMDIKIYTDYILGPYDPVYPDDDFDPAHADTPDVITAVDGDIYLSTRQTYSIILKYARSVTNFVIDARSYVQVSLQYTDNNGNLSDYNVQADNRMLCLVNFMYNRCKPGTDLKIDIKSLDYSIKSKIHIAYSTKLLPDCLTLKAKDNYEMTGVPAVVAITTDISSYSVRVSAKSNPSNASMSNPQELKPDGIVIFKNPYSLVFIPSPLNGGYYDIYYFTRQG